MAEALRGKIKALAVDTPQGHSGKLLRESQYVFNYDTQDRQAELALGMPLRAASYNSSQPHPIFAMNLPEGNLRHKIRERYGKAFNRGPRPDR
jgi:serine/threonine-protein kinase HipA